MAIIRINHTLTREILANVDKVFAPQLDAATAITFPDTCTAEKLYERMFYPWKDAMMALPREMIPYSSEFVITKVYDKSFQHTFKLPTAHPLPSRLPVVSHVASDSYMSAHYKLTGDRHEWDDLYHIVVNRNNRVMAVTERIKTFKDDVTKVLKQSSTLAPALKAWPPLWDLLSGHTKDKHKEIVERKRPAVPDTLDTSSLTAALTVIKLTR